MRQTKRTWLALNVALLGCYLGFFHSCLWIGFPWSVVTGIVIAILMSTICVLGRNLFCTRYEFVLYLVLPLDVVLESLIPFHAGYSFYWCAAAFWTVFVVYRTSHSLQTPATDPQLQ